MKHEPRAGLLRWPRMLREWMSVAAPKDNQETWLRDPLSHPAIEAMSVRQLADLPLDRFRVQSAEVRRSMTTSSATSATESSRAGLPVNPAGGCSSGRDQPKKMRLQHPLLMSPPMEIFL